MEIMHYLDRCLTDDAIATRRANRIPYGAFATYTPAQKLFALTMLESPQTKDQEYTKLTGSTSNTMREW